MLRVGIIDVDSSSCNHIQKLIEDNFPEVEVVAATTVVEEGMRLVRSFMPNLVFIDTQLQHISSIEFLEELEDINFNVVLMSEFPFDDDPEMSDEQPYFLQKPITVEALSKAMHGHMARARVLQNTSFETPE